jgi:hypothetical protein
MYVILQFYSGSTDSLQFFTQASVERALAAIVAAQKHAYELIEATSDTGVSVRFRAHSLKRAWISHNPGSFDEAPRSSNEGQRVYSQAALVSTLGDPTYRGRRSFGGSAPLGVPIALLPLGPVIMLWACDVATGSWCAAEQTPEGHWSLMPCRHHVHERFE